MRLLPRLARNSAVYTVANLLQRATGLLLLPIYTRLLTDAEMGVIGVVTSIGLFLSVLFALALNGAATRFYVEYRHDERKLREFWGALLTFIFFFSILVSVPLMVFGERFLSPVLGDIPFFPFMVLGIIAVTFQPFFDIYLAILQTTERAAEFSVVSLFNFLSKATLCILLVVGFGWGAGGALAAVAMVSVVFFVVALVGLRRRVHLCLKWHYLTEALRYALPLLPHRLAGQTLHVVDRLLLNALVGTATAGLYHVAFMISLVVQVAVTSSNRAFTPLFLSAMKDESDAELGELRRMGLHLVWVYCAGAAVLAVFARELMTLFVGADFRHVFYLVPLLAFTFAANGIYCLFVGVLFYFPRTVKLIPIGTTLCAALSIALNWWFITWWGILGAAAATLTAQIAFTLYFGILGHRHSRITWDYSKFLLLFLTAFAGATWLGTLGDVVSWELLLTKLVGAMLLFLVMSALAWRDPFFLLRGRRLQALRSKPMEPGTTTS